MERIGILGGTFNPIHNGHIMLAKKAFEQFALDKVLVMVSKTPPYKDNSCIVSAEHRSNMIKEAIKEYSFMEFSIFELKRDGKIYTADTLTLLTEMNPDTEYYFIIGGDSIRDFHTWYHPEIVLKKATIIASLRKGVSLDLYQKSIDLLYDLYKSSNPHIEFLVTESIDISSSEIREKIYTDDNIKQYLDSNVYDYIISNGLYK